MTICNRFRLSLAFMGVLILGVHAQVSPGATQRDITVTGADARELHLTSAELDKLPQEKVILKNEDDSTSTYTGVRLRSILDQLGVPTKEKLRGEALKQLVIVSARDGYSMLFTLGELDPSFGDARVVLVYKKDDKDLPAYQGPFRLIIPSDKAGARSVRMVQTIRVVPYPAGKEAK